MGSFERSVGSSSDQIQILFRARQCERIRRLVILEQNPNQHGQSKFKDDDSRPTKRLPEVRVQRASNIKLENFDLLPLKGLILLQLHTFARFSVNIHRP